MWKTQIYELVATGRVAIDSSAVFKYVKYYGKIMQKTSRLMKVSCLGIPLSLNIAKFLFRYFKLLILYSVALKLKIGGIWKSDVEH